MRDTSADLHEIFFLAKDYALATTLCSGQAFRWTARESVWEGVVCGRWIRLSQTGGGIHAAAMHAGDWKWLRDYLQLDVDLAKVIGSFPRDPHMEAAVAACRGLRLLRQEMWECLASFILSSTKQIVQIQQVVALLCERFGERLPSPAGSVAAFSFPSAQRIAEASEAELRACKMGFRAPYLRATAQMAARGEIDLDGISRMTVAAARAELMRCPGVGRKVADCVLLFAGGFQEAFPVDIWILKALQQLYFARKRPTPRRLLEFTQSYFGPHAGYAQQYLFHFMRTRTHETVAT